MNRDVCQNESYVIRALVDIIYTSQSHLTLGFKAGQSSYIHPVTVPRLRNTKVTFLELVVYQWNTIEYQIVIDTDSYA